MRVISLTALDDSSWDEAVGVTGLPFRFSHRAVAGRSLETAHSSYRYTPLRVDYSDDASILYPLVRVTRRVNAMSMMLGMPFGLEGTPLPLTGTISNEHVLTLFRALPQCGVLVLSGGAGGEPPHAGAVRSNVTQILDLSVGFDEIWKRCFSDKTRNMCRKAERGGVVVERNATPEGVAAYYRLYKARAREWGYGEPPHAQNLISALARSGAADLWLARIGERPIAGAITLEGSQDLLYWSGAMDRERRQLAPVNAIIRAVIESACQRGLRYLDFGASNGLTGVEAFKRSFGARPHEYAAVTLSTRSYRRLERMRSTLITRSKVQGFGSGEPEPRPKTPAKAHPL